VTSFADFTTTRDDRDAKSQDDFVAFLAPLAITLEELREYFDAMTAVDWDAFFAECIIDRDDDDRREARSPDDDLETFFLADFFAAVWAEFMNDCDAFLVDFATARRDRHANSPEVLEAFLADVVITLDDRDANSPDFCDAFLEEVAITLDDRAANSPDTFDAFLADDTIACEDFESTMALVDRAANSLDTCDAFLAEDVMALEDLEAISPDFFDTSFPCWNKTRDWVVTLCCEAILADSIIARGDRATLL